MAGTGTTDDRTDRSRKRHKSSQKVALYDAVAGRAGYEGFLPVHSRPSTHRDTTSANPTAPVPADEVLFGKRGAPSRYQEDDIYFAHRHLGPEQRLPDEGLLKALHRYVAGFYGVTGGEGDWGSLDETALLALGVLVEEMAVEGMGEGGVGALLEAVGREGS